MDSNRFWQIIQDAREETLEDGRDSYAVLENLQDTLAELEVSEIMIWNLIFEKYQYLSYKNKLWAAAYVMNGGCSDDGFDYFRGWLTSFGKEIFMEALENPDSLAELVFCDEEAGLEEILSVAHDAYYQKLDESGLELPDFYSELDKYSLGEELEEEIESEITYADDIDIEWEEDALGDLLPDLCEKYNW